MNSTTNGARSGADRAAQISAIVARYPDVSEDELHTLKMWFWKESSALEVALLASQDDIRPGYVQYRKDHIDRLHPKEIVVALLILLAVLGCAAMAAHF